MEGQNQQNNQKKLSSLSAQEVNQRAEEVRDSLKKESSADTNKEGRNLSSKEVSENEQTKQEIPEKQAEKKHQKKDSFRKRAFYEIRTMEQDLNRARGKKTPSINVEKESLKESSPQKIEQLRSSENQVAVSEKRKSKQKGVIDSATKKGLSAPSESFLAKLKSLFKRKEQTEMRRGRKKSFGVVFGLIILIFIGGVGYYFYSSGALSSLGGIKELFTDFFKRDEEPIVSIPPVVTSTEPVSIATTSTSTISTSTPSPVSTSTSVSTSSTSSAPEFIFSAAFFEPDEEEIIKLDKLENCYTELKKSFSQEIKADKFRRIIIMVANDFSDLSLAQIWRGLKSLVKGEDYSELISGEVTENWGLAMPGDIYEEISGDYNLFFYGQPDNHQRVVLVFKVDDWTKVSDEIGNWEQTILSDLRKIFLDQEHGEPFTEEFCDNTYRDIAIRYINLPDPDLSLDYALITDKSYLILSTSRESMWAAIDRILDRE